MKSIEERVQSAKRDLALVIAALGVNSDHVPIDAEEILGAAMSAATRVHEELHCLSCLPFDVQNQNAPDYDEREELEAARPTAAVVEPKGSRRKARARISEHR
jgi:hypothetical protein